MATIKTSEIVTNKDSRIVGEGIDLVAIDHGWGSAWWNKTIDLYKDWSSTFKLRIGGGSGTSDGLTFVINGDPRGVKAIGDGGSNNGFFGYDTGGGIAKSYAINFDMWESYGTSSLIGFEQSNNKTIPQATVQLPIPITNNTYTGEIKYSAESKTISVMIGGKTFAKSVDLASLVGEKALLGFTGANGGGTMDLNVSEWSINASTVEQNSSSSKINGWHILGKQPMIRPLGLHNSVMVILQLHILSQRQMVLHQFWFKD